MIEKMENGKAFTLSEVIITLVVLGIVAAITVPMMSNSASDKKWNVARQKAQATIGEAFRLMTVNGEIDKNLSTQQFVEKVIPKYLKINKTCTIAKATECGMSTAANFYKTPDGTKVTLPTTWQTVTTSTRVVTNTPQVGIFANYTNYNHASPNTNNSFMFRTLDGISINFLYNPYCATDRKDKYLYLYSYGVYLQSSMDMICLMGTYDMNGKAGPNKVGYDVGFIGSFYNGFETKTAAVLPHNSEKIYNSIKSINGNYVAGAVDYCNKLNIENNWTLPDIYETSLMVLNQKMLRGTTSVTNNRWFITKTYVPEFPNLVWRVTFNNWINPDNVEITTTDNISYVRCVRANALK